MIDYFRRESTNQELPLATPEVMIAAAREEDPCDQVMQKDTKQILLEAVSFFDTRAQNIIALKFWGGLTNRNIAQILKMNEKTVGVALFRAMKRLKQILLENNTFEMIIQPYRGKRNGVTAGD